MIVVPLGQPVSYSSTPVSSQERRLPKSSSRRFEMISRRETDEIAARASPRKPRVRTPSRSLPVRILLVAWRRMVLGRSSRIMPEPSSETEMKSIPPPLISTEMFFAPASTEFSTISFIADAGRSTTSPAAIILAVCVSSTLMMPKAVLLPSELYCIGIVSQKPTEVNQEMAEK